MEETLISFETAELAKEKGFNEKCFHYYNDKKQLLIFGLYRPELVVKINYKSNSELPYKTQGFYPEMQKVTAPTQSLLQKWLREIHDIHICIDRESLGSDEMGYKYVISYLPKEFEDYKRWVSHLKYVDSFSCYGSTYSGAWGTYEEALEQGLKEALTLI